MLDRRDNQLHHTNIAYELAISYIAGFSYFHKSEVAAMRDSIMFNR